MNITLKDIFIDNSPQKYIPSDELKQAVEIAYALKRPLLLSGEPGTGKTEFARWVANTLSEVGFAKKPIIYNTKSSSTAQDLFYYYDAVAHFRETNTNLQTRQESGVGKPLRTTEDFIELKALGLAFANALGMDDSQLNKAVAKKSGVSETPTGSVVLIDEIDKAPRDFPNDLLNELERYECEIREINSRITLNDEAKKRLVIILTSNFEKSLPEAFLRRCVYYHIDFPKPDKIVEIIQKRLNITDSEEVKNVFNRINDFFKIRNNESIQKKPSTAEAIDWIRVLKDNNLLNKSLFENDKIRTQSELLSFMPILLKRKEDIELFRI